MKRRPKNTFSSSAPAAGTKKYYGIYRAKILDNRDPGGTGKVLVHIYELDGPLNYDESFHQWVPVLSPYGGNPQMGLFMTPPIHADGYVIFEGGNYTKPVWIGSFPFATIKEVDEDASEDAGYTVLRVKPTVPPEQENNPEKIVLKTQYTTVEQPDIEDDENIVENVVSMNRERLELLHVNKSEYEYSGGGVNSSQPSSSISLTDNGIRLQVVSADNKINAINVTTDGIVLESHTGDSIIVTGNSIRIASSDEGEVVISGLENGSVKINGKQVVVDGESLIVGPPGSTGGGGVVTSDSVCPFVGMPIHIGSSKTTVGG